METSDVLGLLDLVVTVALGGIGVLGVSTYRQHRRLRLAQDRLQPYAALWKATGKSRANTTMTPELARELEKDLRDWYFGKHGGALVLPIPTLKMLLLLLDDLEAVGKSDLPDPDGDKAGSTEAADRVKQAVSLLRTQLKLDLDVYGEDEGRQLRALARRVVDPADVDLRRDVLEAACIDPDRWGRASRGRRKSPWFHWDHYGGTGLDGKVIALKDPCPDSAAGARMAQSADSSPAAS